MYINIYIYTHIYVCAYRHMHTNKCAHTLHRCVYIHTYTCLYIHIYIYIHQQMCIHAYIYIHIYIYIHQQMCTYSTPLWNIPANIPALVWLRDSLHIYLKKYTDHIYGDVYVGCLVSWYGAATMSRLLKMIGLFCKRAL